MSTVVLHVPHYHAEQSFRLMFESIGWVVKGPGRDATAILNKYTHAKVNTRLPLAGLGEFQRCNIVGMVKSYECEEIASKIPWLKPKLVWCDINGGIPGEDHGYKTRPTSLSMPYLGSNAWYSSNTPIPIAGHSRYSCYIPFANESAFNLDRQPRNYSRAVSLIHNAPNWGYGELVNAVRNLGVPFYGQKSPDRLIPDSLVSSVLASSLAMVHLKSHDCPGYALYQALCCKCPIILTSRFLDTTRYTDLYEHNATCLVVKDGSVPKMVRQVKQYLSQISDPAENSRIGAKGFERFQELKWKDVEGFRRFITSNFGSTQ